MDINELFSVGNIFRDLNNVKSVNNEITKEGLVLGTDA
jgi:hypothetical protein